LIPLGSFWITKDKDLHERISWRVIYSGTKLKYLFTSNNVGRVWNMPPRPGRFSFKQTNTEAASSGHPSPRIIEVLIPIIMGH